MCACVCVCGEAGGEGGGARIPGLVRSLLMRRTRPPPSLVPGSEENSSFAGTGTPTGGRLAVCLRRGRNATCLLVSTRSGVPLTLAGCTSQAAGVQGFYLLRARTHVYY